MIYKLQLSNKESIQITQEEYEKFKRNIDNNFIEFKGGLVNPSFVVSITIDYEASAQDKKYTQDIPRLEESKLSIEEVRKFRPDFMPVEN